MLAVAVGGIGGVAVGWLLQCSQPEHQVFALCLGRTAAWVSPLPKLKVGYLCLDKNPLGDLNYDILLSSIDRKDD